MKPREDPFDLQALRVDPNDGELLRLAKVPAKVQKRRGHFIKVPWVWFERLAGRARPDLPPRALSALPVLEGRFRSADQTVECRV